MILGAILEIDVRKNSINGQEFKKSDDDAQAHVLIWYSGPFLKLTWNVFLNGQEVKKSDDDAQADVLIW